MRSSDSRGASRRGQRPRLDDASKLIRSRAGSISDDIQIHGSRASGTARPDSDLDIAILVDDQRFGELVEQSFKGASPGSAEAKTRDYAHTSGKLASGHAGLRCARDELQRRLDKDVHISIVRRGGPFEQGPVIPLK